MANITILEALNRSLTATKKYVDDKIAEVNAKGYAPLDSPNFTNSISMGRKEGTTIGVQSVALGDNTTASGNLSHAEGDNTTASGNYSHAEGSYTEASGEYSHAEGYETIASGDTSHAEGGYTTASGESSHAEGYETIASGVNSHAEGEYTTAIGNCSHTEGESSNSISAVISDFSPSTSNDVILTAWNTNKFSLAKGEASHVEGKDNLALGDFSHAEGTNTTASGYTSHAEGNNTTASGNISHAEGDWTVASGYYSHAEGTGSTASGEDSHAEGKGTKASSGNQHVQGKYNIEDTENKYAHIVGNGTSDTARSNAHTLDWQGNGWYAGKLTQEGTPTEDKDLATKKYVDENFLPNSAIHTMTLKLNTNELNFIQSMVTNNYNSALEHITKGDLSSIIDNSIETIIFEGLERYPYKVVGAYRGFSNNERVLLELAIGDSSENYYAVHRLKITHSDDFNRCFLSSFYGDFGKINALNVDNTIEYEPTGNYNPATKKYVDDKVAEANASGGYTHPDSHPASMITGLATVATSGSYNDLNDKPTIPSIEGLATETYVNNKVAGLVDSAPEALNTLNELATALGNDANFATTISNQIGSKVDKVEGKSLVLNTEIAKIHEHGNKDLLDTIEADNVHAHSNKSVIDAITSDMTTKWNKSIPFENTYVSDCDTWLTNGYTKTSTSTTHHPSVCTGADRWGVLFYISENAQNGTGTQMYFPIDGTYAGRVFTRKIVNRSAGAWNLLSTFNGDYNDLTNKPTIPSEYTLPTASADTLGGIKVGAGLSINDGVLSANGGGTADSVDWSNVQNRPTVLSQFTNDSGFISSIPSEYITETELNAKGYLTEHQDISGKVDKVNGKGLSTNDLTDDLKANYDSAYEHSQSTHAPTNAQKNSDITKAEIEAKLTGNITTHTHSQYLTSIPNEYITEQELTSKGYATESQINSAIEAAATTHEEVKTTVNQILGGAYIE